MAPIKPVMGADEVIGELSARSHRMSGESGQVIVVVALCVIVLIGAVGIVFDVGRLYVNQRHLQTATDAAALAAARELPDGTNAVSTACHYGASEDGDSCNGTSMLMPGLNAGAATGGVETSTQLECLSIRTAAVACATGDGCPSDAPLPPSYSSDGGCNAIRVVEHQNVPTTFLGVLGIGSVPISARSTASMAGGNMRKLDVELVIDSTASMSSSDSCGSGVSGIPSGHTSAEDCAKDGVRSLLQTLPPCDTALATCGSPIGDNVAAPFDRVGLMTFPALDNSVSPGSGLGVPTEIDCIKGLTSADTTYTLDPTWYSNEGTQYSNYQVVPFSSDYRTSASAGALNPVSNLVRSVSWTDCPGGTYPDNGGSQGSSITGGGAADTTTANNDSSGSIAGGPGVAGDWSVAATSSPATSVPVPRPSTRAASDFVLVTVTATGLDSRGTICSPVDGASPWTEIGSQTSSGLGSSAITQASFWSVRSSPSDGPYVFTFASGSCGSGGETAAATAIAVRYTGVDPTTPVDAVGNARSGSGKKLTAPAVTTTVSGERVLRVYSSDAISFSSGLNGGQSEGGPANVTGVVDSTKSTPGSTGTATAKTGSSQPWVADTIALEPVQGADSVVIDRPPNPAAGELVLVSVTANGLGGGTICPPVDGTSPWNDIGEGPVRSGSVTGETFYSYRSTLDPVGQTFEFRFLSGSCSSGSPLRVAATAVAVRYAGVNPLTPIDATASTTGDGSRLTAPSVTTGSINDAVISLYGTAATSLSGVPGDQSVSGSRTASGLETTVTSAPGPTGTQTANSGGSASWIAQTAAIRAADPGCSGLCLYGVETPGGSGTYYADAISQAQSALASGGRPDAQKVIILLSDGDATATPNGSNPCRQAVEAAEAAQDAGTWVYAIAYNANRSGGCGHDRNPSMTALCAMHLVADNPSSDPGLQGMSLTQAEAAVCTGAQSSDSAHRFYNEPSGSSLSGIFTSIGQSLTSARLVSDNGT